MANSYLSMQNSKYKMQNQERGDGNGAWGRSYSFIVPHRQDFRKGFYDIFRLARIKCGDSTSAPPMRSLYAVLIALSILDFVYISHFPKGVPMRPRCLLALLLSAALLLLPACGRENPPPSAAEVLAAVKEIL